MAVFIVYNAASLAVLYRRSELGVLRALGTSRARVARLFLTEILGMGILSSFLGIALAWLIARLIFDPLIRDGEHAISRRDLGRIEIKRN